MKQTLFSVLLILTGLFCRAQSNNYFLIFDPNRDAGGQMMKASVEKTVVGMSCDITTMQAEDSIKCLEDVKTFDAEGRVIIHFDLYVGVERHYKYNEAGRVAEYAEIKLGETGYLMKLDIVYDKKGKITELKNNSNFAGAKSVTYYPKEEKLIVSELFTYIDEVNFKDGLITKVTNKNSAEFTLHTALYEYDKKGRIVKQSGEEPNGDAIWQYKITTQYNNEGRKASEKEEHWDNEFPEEKMVSEGDYSYNDAGLLIQKVKNESTTQYLTLYGYDKNNRLVKADYFEGEYFLVSMYYYYR